MSKTNSLSAKEKTSSEDNNKEIRETAVKDLLSPTIPPKRKSPRVGLKRHRDGSIRTIILRADTDHPLIIQTSTAINLFISILSFIFLVLTAAATLYYIIVLSKSEFHSDCTDTLMWANASYESGSIYDHDFKYACFLPFGTNLIMYPFIGIFGLSLTTHLIGMTGFFLIITTAIILIQKVTGADFKGICFGTSVFLGLTLSSKKLREIFWGHTIYYSLGILFLLTGFFLFFRIRHLVSKRNDMIVKGERTSLISFKLTIYVCVFCLFILLTGTDGISALSIFIMPFIAAITAEYFIDSSNRIISMKTAHTAVQVLVIAIMTVLGILLNDMWKDGLYAGYQAANSEYSAMASWPDHVRNLPMAWLGLLGVKNMAGKMLMEGEGLSNLFFIINALIIAVIPVIATCFYPRYNKDEKSLRYWIWVHWSVTGIVLLGYICGILSAAEWRLTPIFGTAVILSILFLRWAVIQKTAISRMTLLLFVPIVTICVINIGSMFSTPKDRYKENDLFGIVEALEGYGLDTGYSTFWRCNSITVLSGNKIKVREVTVDEKGVNQRHYQSSKKWYEDMKDEDEFFLLLSNYEYSVLNNNSPKLKDEAIQKYEAKVNSSVYHILVFDHNILKDKK